MGELASLVSNLIPQIGKTVSVVVFHRAGSDIGWLPDSVELRELDLEKGSAPDIADKVADIQVFLSLADTFVVEIQKNLVPALQASKNLITFIPSDFGCPWTEEDLSYNTLMQGKEDIIHQAEQAGLPLTLFKNGLIVPFALEMGYPAVSVKNNTISLYEEAKDKEIHYLTGTHIARALSDLLVSQQPSAFANKTFSIVQYHPTGREYIAALEKINGSPPVVDIFTDERFFEDMKADPFPVGMRASQRRLWKNGFDFPGVILNPDDGEKSFEEVLREAKDSYGA